MANFVVSVEKVQTTFTVGGVNTVNLSKSQDETQCVPFYTMRFTADQTNNRTAQFCRLVMIDNGGTPAVQVHWTPSGATIGDITVDIFVVEYGSNVTVQSGTTAVTGTSATQAITAVTLANAFIVTTQDWNDGASSSADWEDSFMQASFNSTIEIAFERRAGGHPDWDVTWYVVESDGTDFTTEYVEFSWSGTDQGPTTAGTITAVTLAKAFLICTYECDEIDDDMDNAIVNMALTATTTLTWYRNHGGSPTQTGTIGVWVVKTSGTEFSVERFAKDVNGATTNTQAITAIDQAKAILISNQNVAGGCWPINSYTATNVIDNLQHSLIFTSTTEVTLQRFFTDTLDGTNNNVRFEVVEFELIVAGAASLTMAPYQAHNMR